jgi:hypothetical protein
VKEYAITLTANTVTMYGNKEVVELPFSNRELGQQLQDYFINWLEKSSFEVLNELESCIVSEKRT